jgi:murein L,D-transpeptidase YcbB/YkuD
MQPEFREYNDLQQATKRFVQAGPMSDQQLEITFPAEDQDLLHHQIREALINLGYLEKLDQDTGVIAALKRFQHDHGLDPDGKPGRNTIDALEMNRLERYRILALNLDRLRKQPIYGENLLYVNIPAYRLKIFRNNHLVDTFRVIVGHPGSPTPRLTGTMQTIIANPVWFVPRSITLREILPKIKSDSGYLSRNGFKLLDESYRIVDATSLDLKNLNAENFNYTLRQSRGADNSLGQVKFVFSNPHAIYLHDTPGKSLFYKDIRAFSHGCVRVKDPERLAGYIVREINADTTDVARLIRQGGHHEIDVAGNLPIHIRYITCEADQAGNLHFFKDIYNLDKKEMESLARLMETQNTGLLLSSFREMAPKTGESCR